MSSSKNSVLSSHAAFQPLNTMTKTSSKSKHKRLRVHSNNEEFNVKRAKVSSESDTFMDYSLLHLFVEYAWEGSYGKCSMYSTMQLAYWIKSENIDFKSNDWYSPESMDISSSKGQLIFAKLAYTLRFILPLVMKSKGSVKCVDEYGQTVLHIFLKNYMWNLQPRLEIDFKLNKIVAALITKGASVNETDYFGSTPFSIAVSGFRRDLCQLMLPYFWNVNARDGKGNTVLHKCVDNRAHPKVWCDIVEILLSKGADSNIRNKEGLTPVHLAAKNGKNKILSILAKNRADFTLRTFNGDTCLMLYCRNERNELLIETVELLLTDDCDVSVTDEYGYSAIHYATRHGANAIVDRLGEFHASNKLSHVEMNVTMLSASFTTDDEEPFSESFDVSIEAL